MGGDNGSIPGSSSVSRNLGAVEDQSPKTSASIPAAPASIWDQNARADVSLNPLSETAIIGVLRLGRRDALSPKGSTQTWHGCCFHCASGRAQNCSGRAGFRCCDQTIGENRGPECLRATFPDFSCPLFVFSCSPNSDLRGPATGLYDRRGLNGLPG